MTAARDALAAALPIDWDDGTVVIGFEDAHGFNFPQWGPPETAADAIVAKLAADGWEVVRSHRVVVLGPDRAVCAADGLPWPCREAEATP